MKRCKHTTSTARSAFLRSSVLLSPLLFSSFPLLFSPLLLLYSRLGEETRPNDERTSLKLVSHKLRARKLVSEIRHFSQPLPPPLHSSLEHTGTLLRPYFSVGTYTSCTPPPCHGPLFSLSCYKPEENRKDRPLSRQKVDHEKSSYRANQEYPPHQLFFSLLFSLLLIFHLLLTYDFFRYFTLASPPRYLPPLCIYAAYSISSLRITPQLPRFPPSLYSSSACRLEFSNHSNNIPEKGTTRRPSEKAARNGTREG